MFQSGLRKNLKRLTLFVDHVLGLEGLDGAVDLVGAVGGVVELGGGDGQLLLAPLQLVFEEDQLALKGLDLAFSKLRRTGNEFMYLCLIGKQ